MQIGFLKRGENYTKVIRFERFMTSEDLWFILFIVINSA